MRMTEDLVLQFNMEEATSLSKLWTVQNGSVLYISLSNANFLLREYLEKRPIVYSIEDKKNSWSNKQYDWHTHKSRILDAVPTKLDTIEDLLREAIGMPVGDGSVEPEGWSKLVKRAEKLLEDK